MKKHQAPKRRKASKSTRIARMRTRIAKREQRRIAEEHLLPGVVKPDAPPMPPARRAFQDET